MARERQEVTTSYADPWKPEKVNEELAGLYLGYRTIQGPRKGDEPFKSHVIKLEDNTFKGVSGAMIDEKMSRIPKGAYVWITYLGMVKMRNGEAKDFKVDVEKGTRLLDPEVKSSGDDIAF